MKRISIVGILMMALLFAMTSCDRTTKDKNKAKGSSVPFALSDEQNEASCAYLTTDEKGIPLISWVEVDTAGTKHFFFKKWKPEEQAFGERIPVPIAQNMAVHEEGMPKIAVKGNGEIVAVYETSTPIEGMRFGIGDVHYVQSSDGGETWTAPQPVYGDNEGKISYGFGNITRMGNGEIGAAALGTDLSPDRVGRPIVFTRTDGDNGFIEPTVIEKQACECCRTALAGDADGKVSLVYRDLLPGSVRDISISLSDDNGKEFRQPEDFSKDHWVVNGCPHNGPAVVMQNEKVYTAWYSGGAATGVHYAEMDQNGKVLTKKDLSREGRFIQLTVMPDGMPVTAYSEDYNEGDSVFSRIKVEKIGEDGNLFVKELTAPKAQASYPVIQAIDKEDFMIAWVDNDRIYYQTEKAAAVDLPANEVQGELKFLKKELPLAELSSDIDPVCGMKMDEVTLGDTTLYKEELLGFCSDHCKHQFLKDPDHYFSGADLVASDHRHG